MTYIVFSGSDQLTNRTVDCSSLRAARAEARKQMDRINPRNIGASCVIATNDGDSSKQYRDLLRWSTNECKQWRRSFV